MAHRGRGGTSAFTFQPLASRSIDPRASGMTGFTTPARREKSRMRSPSTFVTRDRRDRDRLPWAVHPAFGERQLLAHQILDRSKVRPHGPAAESADLTFDVEVDLAEENTDDDVERRLVGVASAEDLASRDPGGGHGAVDRLAAAVYEDGPEPDRFHEDDVLESSPGAAAGSSTPARRRASMTVSRSAELPGCSSRPR